ncbi:conjugal transfer protein MobA [Chitinophaga sp. GbtcB8]|uniref:conjugal transfer protein MobA n=1 Tax=Chitinophaga sp. GbtcB8 TaxID=2824753 RepID=UPI001C30C34E|nr:conjugal transfer protein MobA [Chitinophaga sp. GbtcB8]
MDEKKNIPKRRYGGRNPKNDPAVFRYSISLNAEENARFLSLFEQSGMDVKAHFITACIFQKTIKTVKIDKAAMDYYMRLTTLYAQFRAVGVNYNQVVKLLYGHFSEKKAAAYLFKLEKQTAEMAALCQKIIRLTEEYETKHLKRNG